MDGRPEHRAPRVDRDPDFIVFGWVDGSVRLAPHAGQLAAREAFGLELHTPQGSKYLRRWDWGGGPVVPYLRFGTTGSLQTQVDLVGGLPDLRPIHVPARQRPGGRCCRSGRSPRS